MMRAGIVAAAVLSVVLSAGAAILWSNGWLHDLVMAQVSNAGSHVEARADSDPLARLVAAIREHDAATVESVLAGGVDPNSTDADGETLLNIAVLDGTLEIVEVMLRFGADPDAPGRNGLGPLAMAALAGRHASLDRLMQASKVHAATAGVPAPATLHFEPPTAAAKAAASATLAPSAGEVREDVATVRSDSGRSGRSAAAARGDGDAVVASLDTALPDAGGTIDTLALRSSEAARADAANLAGGNDPAQSTGTQTAWIVAVQRRLGELGFYKGAPDGIAGPQTTNAIASYQAVAGLPQDGLVSEDLLLRIGAKVDAQPSVRNLMMAPPAPAARPAPPTETRRDQAAAQPNEASTVQAVH